MYFRAAIFDLVLLAMFPSTSFSGFAEYAHAILSRAPTGWAIAEKRLNVVPEGFLNKDVKGELYVFCGPKKVIWNWKDSGDNWHHDAIAYESLEIWLLPGNYSPGIKTYLTIKGPVLPSKVYDSQALKVYAMPSHRLIITENEFNKLIHKATTMYWNDSGGKHELSWPNWKSEIVISLQSFEHSSK